MVAVMVDPLVQEVVDRELADLRVRPFAHQLFRSQRSDHLDALASQRLELRKQLPGLAVAVMPRLLDGSLIPRLERGIVGADDHATPARERAFLSFEDVPDTLVHAPLALGGMP